MTLRPVTDRLIFAATNLWLYFRYPRFTLRYLWRLKQIPNFAAPRRLTEMVQWRKLFDRNPLFALFSDKLNAKVWAQARCPELAIPEIVWVARTAEEIPDHLITADHVIKSTHGSSQNHFPGRTGAMDRAALDSRLDAWLRSSRAWHGEWAYGQVQPKLIVERLIPTAGPMMDFCFRAHDGRISMASVATGYKTEGALLGYFNPDGSRLASDPYLGTAGGLPGNFALPAEAFRRAGQFAERLSKGVDYVRVDILWSGEQLYFGEITVYPASGYGPDVAGVSPAILDCWISVMDACWFMNVRHPAIIRPYANAFRRRYSRSLGSPAAPGARRVVRPD